MSGCCVPEPVLAEPCAVVLDNDCTAAPQSDGPGTRGRCYSCGNAVCASCSTIRLYMGARRRICATCEQQRFEDGEARVLVRLHHHAGYPDYKLADARRQLENEARERKQLRTVMR